MAKPGNYTVRLKSVKVVRRGKVCKLVLELVWKGTGKPIKFTRPL